MEFIILSKKQPQKWSLIPGQIFKPLFPSAFSSITKLEYLNLSPFDAFFPPSDPRALRKRGMIPYSRTGYQYFKEKETHFVLKKIIKEAKNLKSLELEWSFKGIRRLLYLKNLALKISTRQILAYPQLLKHLNSLQKIELYLKWSSDTDKRIISKFFGFVLNLPKLQSLVIWLHQGWNYYKNLLFQIHQKGLPSFEVIVLSTVKPSDLDADPLINWANFVDTLYLGSINPYLVSRDFFPRKEPPEKVVRFNNSFHFDEEDAKNGSKTIKNLLIFDLFCGDQNPSVEDAKSLLTFISNMKALEDFTLSLGPNFMNYRDLISPFLQVSAQIKSLESLTSFTSNLNDRWGGLLEVSPPYGCRMNNLRNLCLILYGKWVNLSDWTEALKGLVNLENFYFIYVYSIRERTIYWDFPFEWLKNLKRIYIHCGNPFLERSIDKFFQGISQMENLNHLEISGRIFEEVDRKKIDGFIGSFGRMKSLKNANFIWKETKVRIQRINGKLVFSTERIIKFRK